MMMFGRFILKQRNLNKPNILCGRQAFDTETNRYFLYYKTIEVNSMMNTFDDDMRQMTRQIVCLNPTLKSFTAAKFIGHHWDDDQ